MIMFLIYFYDFFYSGAVLHILIINHIIKIITSKNIYEGTLQKDSY